jgi:outer membrane receptor protein involved in Fe transport
MVSGDRDQLLDALSPGIVSIAKPDDVKGEHKSIPDLLDQIPGVYVRSQSGSAHYTTASIRGSAPSQVNIYVDGVPMNLSNEMAADISTLPVSGIERVEVYRGTTPARFSGAPVGGAINIITKKPTEFIGSISIGKRSFNSEQYATNMHFPFLTGHMMVAVDRDTTDGNFEYTDKTIKTMNSTVFADGSTPASQAGMSTQLPAKRKRQANRVDKENLLIKWEDKRFIFKFAATDLDRMMPGSVPEHIRYIDHTQDLPQYTPDPQNHERRQVMRKREAIAGWRESFGAIDTAINLTWLKNKQSYRDALLMTLPLSFQNMMGGAWNDYTTTRKGVSGDLVWRLNEAGSFKHQVEFHTEYYDEKLEADLSGRIIDSDFLSQFHRKKRNVQLQDMITIAPLGGLQITPLIRAEKLTGPTIGSRRNPALKGGSGDYNWETTGSLNAKKAFENGWQLFGGTGTYIRYPNFYEIYGNGWGIVPNSDSTGKAVALVPEKGRTVEAGFGWQGRFSEDFRGNFRITGFERKTENNISLLSTPIAAKYINVGDAIFRGIEIEGNIAWTTRADIQFAVTKQEAHYTGGSSGYFYFGGNSVVQRFPGQTIHVLAVPDVTANVRLNMRFFNNTLSAFIEGNHIGRIYYNQDQWEKPLTRMNVGGSWLAAKVGPNKGLRVSFGVNDVFNEGPKQEMGRDGGYMFTHPNSNFYPQQYSYSPNVLYPYQGRTVYATLNWSY